MRHDDRRRPRDTVADLEDLRAALGAERWSLDGVSYGSYVAQRYATAHPDRVDRLVLDSVVPVTGFDPLLTDVYPEVARVLRAVCDQTDDICRQSRLTGHGDGDELRGRVDVIDGVVP